ncbi:conserved Plasmodium protein, unknown function [Plasmodium berghei]|uniref:Uncharacterized protein n=2 Tax=Plasmodium berghei TaxID=5821 RepID=A0A509AI99_PLABA|nr:conserved Plasmodium protein, unknown function [Plasmodium berghei ANKA]CXI29407.1 conserved Plasmodium protein, unknown function [Plasmodium berghei]SCM20713.1 conserved Plasmodium protein, unknown function [Plasmodium berghei]SCN24276.1 conserved Plasmodium protein, unknown function [Plasmodium berghei]SCO60707.1 conserved Plasmodium protein, unknown function [Plasmodium berghei]VUC55196.1 conserved Plasmodium protein, unknown function [Plasmodium berghei ANKA]|eukprot:XP_034421009.1 conserved Plasmodium protein, unknown function [Plasmodium berghei ANKA]
MDAELNESVHVDDTKKEIKKRKKRKKKIIINVKKKVPKKNITINENVISDATEMENSINKEILDISIDNTINASRASTLDASRSSTINASRSSTINASRSSTIDIPQTSISNSKTNYKMNTKKGNRTPKDNQIANFFGREYNAKEIMRCQISDFLLKR